MIYEFFGLFVAIWTFYVSTSLSGEFWSKWVDFLNLGHMVNSENIFVDLNNVLFDKELILKCWDFSSVDECPGTTE